MGLHPLVSLGFFLLGVMEKIFAAPTTLAFTSRFQRAKIKNNFYSVLQKVTDLCSLLLFLNCEFQAK